MTCFQWFYDVQEKNIRVLIYYQCTNLIKIDKIIFLYLVYDLQQQNQQILTQFNHKRTICRQLRKLRIQNKEMGSLLHLILEMVNYLFNFVDSCIFNSIMNKFNFVNKIKAKSICDSIRSNLRSQQLFSIIQFTIQMNQKQKPSHLTPNLIIKMTSENGKAQAVFQITQIKQKKPGCYSVRISDGFFQVKSVFIDEASQLIIKGLIKMFSIVQGCLNHRPPDFFFIKHVKNYWDFPASVGKFERFKFGMPNINPKGNNQIYWDAPEGKRTSFDRLEVDKKRFSSLQGQDKCPRKSLAEQYTSKDQKSHDKQVQLSKPQISKYIKQQKFQDIILKRRYALQVAFRAQPQNLQESKKISILSIRQNQPNLNQECKKNQKSSDRNIIKKIIPPQKNRLQQQTYKISNIQEYNRKNLQTADCPYQNYQTKTKEQVKAQKVNINQDTTNINIARSKQTTSKKLEGPIMSNYLNNNSNIDNQEDQIDRLIAQAKKSKKVLSNHVVDQQPDIQQLIAKAKQQKIRRQIQTHYNQQRQVQSHYNQQKKTNINIINKVENIQDDEIDLLIAKAKQQQNRKLLLDQQSVTKRCSFLKITEKSASYEEDEIELLIAKAKQQKHRKSISNAQPQPQTIKQFPKFSEQHIKQMENQCPEQDQIQLLIAKAKQQKSRKMLSQEKRKENIYHSSNKMDNQFPEQDLIQLLIAKAKEQQTRKILSQEKTKEAEQINKITVQFVEQDQIQLLIQKAKEQKTLKMMQQKQRQIAQLTLSNKNQNNFQQQDQIQLLIAKAKQQKRKKQSSGNKITEQAKNNDFETPQQNKTKKQQIKNVQQQDDYIQQLIAKAKQKKNQINLNKKMDMEGQQANINRNASNDKKYLFKKMSKQKLCEPQTNNKPCNSILDPNFQKQYSDFPNLALSNNLDWWIKCKVLAKQVIQSQEQFKRNVLNDRKNNQEASLQTTRALRCIVRDKNYQLFSIVLYGISHEELQTQSYYNISGGELQKTNCQDSKGGRFYIVHFKNHTKKVIIQKCAAFQNDQSEKLDMSQSYLPLSKVLEIRNESLIFSVQGILKKIKIVPMKEKSSSLVIYYIVDPISECQNSLVQFTNKNIQFKNKVPQLQNQVATFFHVYAKYNQYTKKICMYPKKFTMIKFRWAQRTDRLTQMVRWLQQGNLFDNFCSTAEYKSYSSIGQMKKHSNKTKQVMLENAEIIKFGNKRQYQVCNSCMRKTTGNKCQACNRSGIIRKISISATIADQTGKLLVMWSDQAADYLFKNRSCNKVIQHFTMKKIRIWMIKPESNGSPYFVKRIQVKASQQLAKHNRCLIDYLKVRVKDVTL